MKNLDGYSLSRTIGRCGLSIVACGILAVASPILSAQEDADAAARRAEIEQQFDQLRQAVQQDEPDSMSELWILSESLVEDQDPTVAALANTYKRIILLQSLLDGDRQKALELEAAVLASLEVEPITIATLDFAMQAARGLEKSEAYALALSVYGATELKLATTEATTGSESMREQALESIQRLARVGKPLEIQGATIGGGEVDSDALAGQVVLVDFWASWCAPCREEMPLIRQMADRYGKQGFAVVGISMDEDSESANMFLERNSHVNWPILFESNQNQRGFEHPLAKQVGVTRLPTAVLLDRQGKVVSLSARGENLERWLAIFFDDSKSRRSQLRPDGMILNRGETPNVSLEHQDSEQADNPNSR